MKSNLQSAIILTAVLFVCSCMPQKSEFKREVLFNKNWKFIRADINNAEKTDFDDSRWRLLDVPHDYSIEDLPPKDGIKQIGPFSEESVGVASTGHVVGGTAWYRKHFTLNNKDKGKIIKILFDGVYMNADFWINGNHLGNHPYGYTAFAFDLTKYLNPAGQDNVLTVQVKNEGENSRWYSGSGIYRNVSLLKLNPVHIDLWGVYISTPEVSKEKASVKIETKIVNTELAEGLMIKAQLINPDGQIVTKWTEPVNINNNTIVLQTELENPLLWSHKNPVLYSAQIQLVKGNDVLDRVDERFGVRSIEFSPEKGFLLNGESILLKGGCLHHDNGPLGSAAFETAEYRRVKIMKQNGFNAIRTAHNPPSKVFLEACDELGMLVMNESFDQWQHPKKPEDYNLYFDEWWEKDTEAMVLRDRNHPSIIIWSIGNEIYERADSSGLAIAMNLKKKIKELDKIRPVTQAICHFWDRSGWEWDRTAPVFEQMDIHSYNYQWNNYQPDHEKYPERIIIGTESFPKEAFDNWQLVEKYPYITGDFVWTGMDYLGESGIGHTKPDNSDIGFLPPWPWFNAYCGDISILGYKKPQMYYRDVVWRNSELEMMVHAPVPEGRKEVVSMWGWPEEWKSWNWEGNEGKPLQVSVYSRCDQVRLELNGKVIGTKDISGENPPKPQMSNPMNSRKVAALAAYFEVPYEAGDLVAIGLKNGKEVIRQSLKTTGKPVALKIMSEQDTVKACVNDLAYFNIEVVDEVGNLVPDVEVSVEFNIQGKCKLQAVGNGNPTDMKSFQQPRVKTFRGRCQLIVRSCEEGKSIIVSAKSDGLKEGKSIVVVN